MVLAAGLGIAWAPATRAQEDIRTGLVSVRDGVVVIDVPIHFAGMRCVGRPDCEPPIVEYEEIVMDDDPAFRQKLLEMTGRWTVPQIFIDDVPIGGYTELWCLDRDGRLDDLAA